MLTSRGLRFVAGFRGMRRHGGARRPLFVESDSLNRLHARWVSAAVSTDTARASRSQSHDARSSGGGAKPYRGGSSQQSRQPVGRQPRQPKTGDEWSQVRISAAGSPAQQRPGRQSTRSAPARASVKPRRFWEASHVVEDVAVPQATFVPRDPAVKDGVWNHVDEKLVVEAQTEAEAAVAPKRVDGDGFVLLGKSEEELKAFAEANEQEPYRGKQLLDAVLHGARRVEDIAQVPSELRDKMSAACVRTGRSIIHHSVVGKDGTRKLLLQLADGRVVETVGIPTRNRLTVCVSSQVGCPMRCSFCATGKGGFARNLSVHEIVDQALTVQEVFGRRVRNVVFMGMGEPLLNLPSVVGAIKVMNSQMGISGRGITVSTVGVPNAIAKLATHKLPATLAVSIHAPNQALRESIIPSAKAYPLEALMQDCSHYFKTTGRRVTFEYTLMSGTNSLPEHAEELAALLRRFRLMSHVNLIPWNPVEESEYKRPSAKQVRAFKAVLKAAGVPTSVRTTRGLEAAAACGQLRNQYQKMPLKEFALPE